MTPNAKRQATYRARYTKRTEALKEIITEMGDSDKPKAIRVRAIAEEGLR